MMLSPGYGETPIDGDELDALLPRVREILGPSLTKASVYDLEQAVAIELAEELLVAVIDGDLNLKELLNDHFVRDLHRRLFGDIWTWAGVFRKREFNLGVAPQQIASELRASLDTIDYRWIHTDDWTPRQLGMAVHAEIVRIHPFTDGNGRSTRLLADLVLNAAQDADAIELYDWDIDKSHYIRLLSEYDQHRNPNDLAAFVRVRALEE